MRKALLLFMSSELRNYSPVRDAALARVNFENNVSEADELRHFNCSPTAGQPVFGIPFGALPAAVGCER